MAQTVSNTFFSTIGSNRLWPRAIKEIDGWRIVRKLGEGGMGTVYLAEKPHGIVSSEILHRRVALKTFDNRLDRKQIAKEIKAQSDFNHPNLVHYLGHGTFKGVLYLLMNYIQGMDTRKLMKGSEGSPQPLSLAEACAIGSEVAKGLRHIHAKAGFVHRDVKPANIMLSDEGSVVLGDLGLAEISGGKDGGGTPEFVAPEQARQEKTDYRADIYSLGCTLQFFLTGRTPYAGVPHEKLWGRNPQGISPTPVRDGCPAIPKDVAELIESMVALDPDQRPDSCDGILDTLELHRGGARLDALYSSRSPGQVTVPNTQQIEREHLPRSRPASKGPTLALTAGVPSFFVMGALLFFTYWPPGDTSSKEDLSIVPIETKAFQQHACDELLRFNWYDLLMQKPTPLSKEDGISVLVSHANHRLTVKAMAGCIIPVATLCKKNFTLQVDVHQTPLTGDFGLCFGMPKQGERFIDGEVNYLRLLNSPESSKIIHHRAKLRGTAKEAPGISQGGALAEADIHIENPREGQQLKLVVEKGQLQRLFFNGREVLLNKLNGKPGPVFTGEMGVYLHDSFVTFDNLRVRFD